MNGSMESLIRELREMKVPDLVERYAELWGKPPRCRRHAHLWRRCAWKLMERRHGGLSRKAKARLEELIGEIDLPGLSEVPEEKPKRANPGELSPGTVLCREWRGKQIRVVVRGPREFEFDGETFASLSAIAQHVTSTKWNGPAWFGLRARRQGAS